MARPGHPLGAAALEEVLMCSSRVLEAESGHGPVKSGRIRWREGGLWSRAHPGVAVAVIVASCVAVLALQFVDTHGSDAIALLYVLPIGLAAVTFGLRGGLASAAGGYLAFGLFAVLSTADHVRPDGWLSRAAAMFLLGGLLGRAHDRTAQATRVALAHQRQSLIIEEENRRYSEGIELSDSILQHVAAAKWAIERGDEAAAARLLSQALSSGQEMVSELLPPHSPGPSAGRNPA